MGLDDEPKTLAEHQGLAVAARQRGDLRGALAHLDAAQALDPEARFAGLAVLRGECLIEAGEMDAAEAVLAAAQAAHPGNLWPPYHRAVLARRRGDLRAAEAHLADAKRLDGENRVVSLPLLLADCRLDAGDTDAAEAVLAAACKTHPGNMWPPFRLAGLLRRRGDLSGALAHLDAAQALDPEGRVAGIPLLRAECLIETGAPDAAEAVLAAAEAAHPGNLWPPYHRAVLAQRRGDLTGALAHLAAARALDPEGQVAGLALLQADCLIEAGDLQAAQAALAAVRARHPADQRVVERSVRLAQRMGRPEKVRVLLEAGVAQFPGNRQLAHLLAEQRIAERNFAAAIAGLEALRKRDGDTHAQTLLLLARAYRSANRLEQEVATVLAALKSHARDVNLLRYIFMTYTKMGTPQEVDEGLELVRARLGPDQADGLEILVLLQTMQFHIALPAIRRQRRARRSLAEAQRLVSALFGSHHYALGLRYARFCLRRWPGDPGLWTQYVRYGLRLGRMDEVSRRIDAADGVLAEPLLTALRHLRCGYGEDFAGAVACYERLQALDRVTPESRDLQTMLTFNLCHPAEADAVAARIGAPGDGYEQLLHRSGLPGMMALEFDLECQAMAGAGGHDSLADWVRQRPGTSMAAIHLIDAWRREAAGAPPDPAAEPARAIPRRIFQYWDTAAIPEPVGRMIGSWARAPGFTHQLLDRAAGLAFLRETFGIDWVRAFQLAQDAAQQADLLRLCLLAHHGGVYADADDYLYGDLGRLLAPGQGGGLILYRESAGGALGNNFIAAPPQHPAIVYAARLARDALAQRSFELAWTKTGPGLLTRAVAQYMLHVGPEEARAEITVLDYGQFARQVSQHNPVKYKEAAAYWGNAQKRRPETRVWQPLLAALRDTE